MGNIKEIALRLEKLREYIQILKELKSKCVLADFKRDKILRGALERYLRLAAETAIDIGEIVISELKLETPMFNKDIFEILGRAKIIPLKLADSFFEIAKFRNILVHDYVDIDLEKMYGYLNDDLEDFDKFIKAIAKFLKKIINFMVKVMVFGTFDVLHSGHLSFFKQAKKQGDYLIAVLARDKTVLNVKKRQPLHNEQERLKAVKNSGLADKVLLGRIGDKYAIIKKFRPAVIALGYDQKFFIDELEPKLKEFGLTKTKIVKLKPFKPEIYKSSIISKI